MAEQDDAEKGYRWENEYEKTWEILQEDEAGSLQATIDDIISKGKRRRLLEKIGNIRLGIMRHLFVVLDMSWSMSDPDLRPSRFLTSLKLLEHFIEEYFDQNPISQLGLITTSNKRGEKITELGGNPRRHIQMLRNLSEKSCEGEASLQNALMLALQSLKHMPSHASREVLIIYGSLTTCDPGDINNTIQLLQEHNVRCSVIGLAAEVHICKKLCKKTSGVYSVILSESHYRDLLNQHISPPPATEHTESSLIKMGFPHHSLTGDHEEKLSMCMCHLDVKSHQGFSASGYFCPQCKSKYCELPTECKICGLTLVSAPHLARSYHHLFPLELFPRTLASDLPLHLPQHCYSCMLDFKDPNVYVCKKCEQPFCEDCDVFIHETLHSCPGCSSHRGPLKHPNAES